MAQIARNHTNHRVGECHGKAKLTDKEVRRMRFLREYNPIHWTYLALAAEFGCGESTVRDIVQYRTRASA
jgi:AraC-like DNA-binding protein